ncbi:MAG: 16S rRNA (uracil(1498)-N(3))-methyltransferase [Clostridiales bacterium]|nr:16S rRNA (uracil(1498)-N(3))-methyltransferase [Clostridiales bacterium]
MRRLFVPPEALKGDRIHITDKDDIFYLSTVLRMKVGDKLLITIWPGEANEACASGSGQGKVYEAGISEIGRDGFWLDIARELPACEGRGTRITLYQGLPKGAKMDEIVRKSTELGVCRIAPVVTARSVPGADGVSAAKAGRWRRIAEEAARQSRRIEIPEVLDPMGFEAAAAGLKGEGYDLVLVLFELEEGRTLKQALREGHGGVAERAGEWAPKVAVFVGPEGGFENEEVERIIQEGAISVTVGETILRTETAGPAAIAMVLYEYEL